MHVTNWLDRILGLVCSVFDGYSAVLFLRDGREEYHLASSFSLGDSIDPHTLIRPGAGLVGWIIKNKKPLLINRFDRNVGCLGYYPAEGESKIKAFMGTHLPGEGGVLCIDSKKTYSFSDKDQKILYQFAQLIEDVRSGLCQADQTAQSIDYYRYLTVVHGLRVKYPKWRIFLEKLLEVLTGSTGFRYCFMAARDEVGQGYFVEGLSRELVSGVDLSVHKFNMDAGLLGWVFKHGSPIFSGQEEGPAGLSLFGKEFSSQNFRSVICLPLVVHKKTRGVLVLADPDSIYINSEMRAFVQMVGDYLALFLENLYLKSRVN
ncbi:GAF domain-containing protein [Desulfonatronovibrio hydrogenovorans]|uniref:GAF domain-containing protein n=1 Tax=Desulfonatronovibrio hydrogenovorans TaxID=53245 RepID=UPI000490CCE3|nr:GAF domain-containing protein [Desulfonatronovibrio hydrogenovorans]